MLHHLSTLEKLTSFRCCACSDSSSCTDSWQRAAQLLMLATCRHVRKCLQTLDWLHIPLYNMLRKSLCN